MTSFEFFEDMTTIVDPEWIRNVFVAAGVLGDDKFSIYENRDSFGGESAKILQVKNGHFDHPSFVLVVNKVCQLICIGDVAARGKRNVCYIYGGNAQILQLTQTGLHGMITKKIKSSEYLQSNGNNVYYFPNGGIKTSTFFSFVQVDKDEYLVESVNGEITDDGNVRKITDRQLLQTVLSDCWKGGE